MSGNKIFPHDGPPDHDDRPLVRDWTEEHSLFSPAPLVSDMVAGALLAVESAMVVGAAIITLVVWFSVRSCP